MAYRQLYAVTFAVLGLVAVGCGGETGTNAVPNATEQQAPNNSDAPPTNPDQATSTDRAPSNPDSAPVSSTDPAGSGGSLGNLCRRFCSALEGVAKDCGGEMLGMQDFCSAEVDCQVPPNVPCQDELADAFDCVIDNLANLCSAKATAQGVPCEQTVKAFTDCAGAIDDGGNGNVPSAGNGGDSCTPANGCDCADDCASCRCSATTDAQRMLCTDLLACPK